MRHVKGTVQHYPWGDVAAIPGLLGLPPQGGPWAELWFGTHPAAPSYLDSGAMLESVTGELPYLLKVLAAAQPLSLQVHPSAQQARSGFARENAAGVALTSPQRNYRDDRHKPELICALTRFEAVCGIAPLDETDALLAALGAPAASLRSILGHGGADGAIGLLLHERPDLSDLLAAAAGHPDPRCRWLSRLGQIHPNDPSAAIVLILNYVCMEPGQAIYLGAGTMHAYLGGTGIEVMASSDNVLRCGLTDKYVDVDEVLRILDDTPLADAMVDPVIMVDGGISLPVPVDDFRITRYDVDGSTSWIADGPELIICTSGTTVELGRGECAVALDAEPVSLAGTASVFRIGGQFS